MAYGTFKLARREKLRWPVGFRPQEGDERPQYLMPVGSMLLTARIREVATFAATKLVQIFGSIEFANPSQAGFVQTLAGTLEPPPQTPKVGRGRRQADGVVELEIILWRPR